MASSATKNELSVKHQIGYQAGAATQSAGTITGIKALCVLIPAIALVGSWIAFRFVWNITPQIRADMAARKSAAE